MNALRNQYPAQESFSALWQLFDTSKKTTSHELDGVVCWRLNTCGHRFNAMRPHVLHRHHRSSSRRFTIFTRVRSVLLAAGVPLSLLAPWSVNHALITPNVRASRYTTIFNRLHPTTTACGPSTGESAQRRGAGNAGNEYPTLKDFNVTKVAFKRWWRVPSLEQTPQSCGSTALCILKPRGAKSAKN